MGYSNKLVLVDNTKVSSIFPFGLVQTEEAKFSIPLDTGQSITFARIYAQISVPQHLAGAIATVIFNGNTLGNINLPSSPFGGDMQLLNGVGGHDVTAFMDPKGNNDLIIKCDALSADLDFTIYADIFYELNTQQAPSQQPGTSNPSQPGQNPNGPFQLPTWQQIKPYAVVGGVGLAAVIVLPKILDAVFEK